MEAEPQPTPAQVLFRIGCLTGWCETKREFADLIGVRLDNMSAYLADEGNKRRVRATAETIWTWCQTITRATGLHFELNLASDGHATLVVSGVTRAKASFPTTTFDVHEPGWSKQAAGEGSGT